jgi:hypothetical protein
MATARTLDVYKALILPRLVHGPKSQLQLNVPRYALETLRKEGFVRMQTHAYRTTMGRGAIEMWYPAEYPVPAPRDCATMTFDGI